MQSFPLFQWSKKWQRVNDCEIEYVALTAVKVEVKEGQVSQKSKLSHLVNRAKSLSEKDRSPYNIW
jgi:hypothetical protein